MTSEEKVLAEIKEKIAEIVQRTIELKVTEDERKSFIQECSEYALKIKEYKAAKARLEERERKLNG